MPVEPDDSFDFLPEAANSALQQKQFQHQGKRNGSGGSSTSTTSSHHQQAPAQQQDVQASGTPRVRKREDFPFLIAQHAFDARSLDAERHQRDPHAVCLSFAREELAYVHFVHASGWGDVTLVRSGERGWIPVDYFADFSDARAISLLAAVSAFLAQPRSQRLYVAPQRVYTFSEAAINEIISGTKLLLTKAGVLSRDLPLVIEHEDIAHARKSLLTELAHLVHVAKHNKHSTDPAVIDKLVRGCYRLLERTHTLLTTIDAHPPQPQRDSGVRGGTSANGTLSSSRLSTSSSGTTRSGASTRSALSATDLLDAAAAAAATAGTSGGSHSLYRMNSFTNYTTTPLPEQRLYEVASAFANYLQHFLHPHEVLLADPESANTPSVILALTRHCMLACRELLVVLDVVPDTQQLVSESGKDELLEEIRHLVSNARAVVASLPPSPAALRSVAAQNMMVTAERCENLAMTIARTSLKYFRENPGVELPSDRSYPIFTFDSTNLTLSPRNSAGSQQRPQPVEEDEREEETTDFPSKQLGESPMSTASANINSGFHQQLRRTSTNSSREISPRSSVKSVNLQASPSRGGSSTSLNSPINTPKGGGELSPSRVRMKLNEQPTPRLSAPDLRRGPAFVTSPPNEARTQPSSTSSEVRTQPSSTSLAGDTTDTTLADVSVDSASTAPEQPFPGATGEVDDEDGAFSTELVMKNGRVRGGSLRALVLWLTGESFRQLEFEIRTFLVTFRLFAGARDVVIELGSQEPADGVRHFARLWVESFWEPEDSSELSSLAMMAPPAAVSARRRLIEEGMRHAQVTELQIQPPTSTNLAGHGSLVAYGSRSASTSSTTSISSSNGGGSAHLPPHMRRNNSSFGSQISSQFSTQFGTSSTLNLAASFREFGLGTRRASRQIQNEADAASRNMSTHSIDHSSSNANLSGSNGHTRRRSGSQASSIEDSSASFHHAGSPNSNVGGLETAETLLSKPAAEIACQLTLMWFDIFRMLRPSELLDQRFSSSKRSLGLAPHVTQLILSSNHLTAFVGDTVLSPELSTKQRARVLKHWIRVADEFYTLGNLNGAVTIVLTLESSRIVRLSKAWESLGNKSRGIFARLAPLASPERNFQEYRKELRSRHGYPCVPYMGILLGDLTFIDEGNPKLLKPSKAINFDRYLKTAQAIAQIQPFQHCDYSRHSPDIGLQTWLRSQMAKSYSRDTRDADEQWRRSLLIQPD